MSWTTERERGSAHLLRLTCWLTLTCGWRIGRLLLYPITLYYYVTASGPRAASRDYLRRVLGRPARASDVLRHIFTFASVTLDRAFLLSGRTERFAISVEGLDALTALLSRGKGCILLGSHLGSFDVLRDFGRTSPVRVSAVMYRRPGSPMSRLMETLDPDLWRDVITIGSPDAMLRVQNLARGEIVSFLADRDPDAETGPHRHGRFPRRPCRFPHRPLYPRGSVGGSGRAVLRHPPGSPPLRRAVRAFRRNHHARPRHPAR